MMPSGEAKKIFYCFWHHEGNSEWSGWSTYLGSYVQSGSLGQLVMGGGSRRGPNARYQIGPLICCKAKLCKIKIRKWIEKGAVDGPYPRKKKCHVIWANDARANDAQWKVVAPFEEASADQTFLRHRSKRRSETSKINRHNADLRSGLDSRRVRDVHGRDVGCGLLGQSRDGVKWGFESYQPMRPDMQLFRKRRWRLLSAQVVGSNPTNQCDQTCSSLEEGDEGF